MSPIIFDMTSTGKKQKQSGSEVKRTIDELKSPAFWLLEKLVSQLCGQSFDVTTTIEQLALQMHKSEKSIFNAIKTLKDAGLVARIELHGQFKPFVTRLTSHEIVNYFKCTPMRNIPIKKRAPRVKKGEAAFDYLTEHSRNLSVVEDIETALIDAGAYWDYITEAFSEIGFPGKLKGFIQSRSRHTGLRTGTHRGRNCYALPLNAAKVMQRFARFANDETTEASFRVEGAMSPLLLVDDLTIDCLDNLPSSYAILETSPGNFQASICAPRALTSDEFLVAEDGLLRLEVAPLI